MDTEWSRLLYALQEERKTIDRLIAFVQLKRLGQRVDDLEDLTICVDAWKRKARLESKELPPFPSLREAKQILND